MRIVIASSCYRPSIGAWADELQAEFPEVQFVAAETVQDQKAAIVNADGYFGIPPSEVFNAATKLRWVHTSAVGINGVPNRVPELIESDVILTNSKGPNAEPMADHVFAVILTLTHKIHELWDDQKRREWTRSYGGNLVEVSGSTVGILGFGDVGKAVARRALGFGMEVYAVDKRPPAPWYVTSGVRAVWTPDRLDEMLKITDWLVVTVPSTTETIGMVDRRRMRLLKPGSYVVVVSRGGIIDEPTLYEDLRSGRIVGAGLDVTATSPPDDVWDMPNVVISPHCSFRTPEAYEGRRDLYKLFLRRFINGETFPYVCDKRAGF